MSIFPTFTHLPAIQTRKALLLLDFQNDFVRPSGALHVQNAAEILEHIPGLASAFRRVGEVIWVRSVTDTPKPIFDEDSCADCIVLDDKKRSAGIDIDEEAFLSSELTNCCRAQSSGAQFPAPILAAIDHEHDTVWEKSDYSAFQNEELVLFFRQLFVTEVYLCGSLSNISVYATALDAARYGFSIMLIEDCLGFRNFSRHEEAMRRMADILGANGITIEELLEEVDWQETDAIARSGDSQPGRASTPVGIERVMGDLDVKSSPKSVFQEMRANYPPPEPPRPVLEETAIDESVDEDINALEALSKRFSRNHYPSVAADMSRNSTDGKNVRTKIRRFKRPETQVERAVQSERQSKSKRKSGKPLGPGDIIGEGDSRILYELDLPVDAFMQVRSEVCWQKMYHLSGQVPRLVAVQGQKLSDGSIPIYRHPADESPLLQPYTSTVNKIRIIVERILGHPLNHVLIQLYRDGQDRISEHSDKTLDIVRGSFICNVSLGAQRVMVLRTKTSAEQSSEDADAGRHTQRVPLPHESLFILGEKTNMKWLHSIRADKRPDVEKSADERAYGGERISLTFRQIGTFLDTAHGTIWGQGAVSKSKIGAGEVIHGDADQCERLIRAFSQENRSSDFDWGEVYGDGFDVVNFVTQTAARLVPSGDAIADLRVKLSLAESGLRFNVIVDPKHHAGDLSHEVLPRYLDENGNSICGDVEIMNHLTRRSSDSLRPGLEPLRGGSRLDQLEKLLSNWKQHKCSGAKGEPDSLNVWERVLEGSNYLCGSTFGIDDCSLWPILRDIIRISGPLSNLTYPNLLKYYHRVERRGCVREVLGEEQRVDRDGDETCCGREF